ncbi:MAG: hypothetical protein WC554_18060 [Clostridia bacterium]|jgi:alanyl-tRNA synthetase
MQKGGVAALSILGGVGAFFLGKALTKPKAASAEKTVYIYKIVQDADTVEKLEEAVKEGIVTELPEGASALPSDGVHINVGDIAVVDPDFLATLTDEQLAQVEESFQTLLEQDNANVVFTETVLERVEAAGVDPAATAASLQAQVAQVAQLQTQANVQMVQGDVSAALQSAYAASAIQQTVFVDIAQAQAACDAYKTEIVSQPAAPPSQEVKNAIAKYGPSVWK